MTDSTPTLAAALRRRRSTAYLPLVVLALLQGLYIAASPSVSVRQSELGQVTAGAPVGGNPASGYTAAVGGPGDAASAQQGFDPGGSPSTPGFVPGANAVPSVTTPSGGTVPATSPGVSTPAPDAAPDLSHCTPEGRQHDRFVYQQEAVACVPKWHGGTNNGGATYQGVTADTVKIVIFEEEPNAQIDAILATQGIAMSEEDRAKVVEYTEPFLNKYYETYGRHVEFIRFKSACPITPPSLAQCKAEARKVIDMKPFAVLFGMQAYPELFDEWARAGIIAIGGWNFADSYFTERRPFRYDVFMTGTRAARHVVEYYCKKMANQPSANAGRVIHPTIGDRTTPRKLGIIVNEMPAMVEAARYIGAEIAKCEGNRYNPEIVTFVGDIDRAAETQEAVSSKMINTKTTTVLCWCGPLEMTGFSKNFTSQQYYPEHLLQGIGFSDVDLFGRLYDPAQWIHAFGPSHVASPRPLEHGQSHAPFKEAGDEESSTTGGSLYYLYLELASQGIHFAGPNLNPITFEAGLFNSPGTGGGDPRSILWDWGPGDYGGYADVREVWYDPSMTSDFDGRKGGYQVMNNHARYNLGEWPSTFEIPPAAN